MEKLHKTGEFYILFTERKSGCDIVQKNSIKVGYFTTISSYYKFA
jgi:hypothetical protein